VKLIEASRISSKEIPHLHIFHFLLMTFKSFPRGQFSRITHRKIPCLEDIFNQSKGIINIFGRISLPRKLKNHQNFAKAQQSPKAR
jgi:hypothetical protein